MILNTNTWVIMASVCPYWQYISVAVHSVLVHGCRLRNRLNRFKAIGSDLRKRSPKNRNLQPRAVKWLAVVNYLNKNSELNIGANSFTVLHVYFVFFFWVSYRWQTARRISANARGWRPKNTPFDMCYHSEFGRSTSKGVGTVQMYN